MATGGLVDGSCTVYCMAESERVRGRPGLGRGCRCRAPGRSQKTDDVIDGVIDDIIDDIRRGCSDALVVGGGGGRVVGRGDRGSTTRGDRCRFAAAVRVAHRLPPALKNPPPRGNGNGQSK